MQIVLIGAVVAVSVVGFAAVMVVPFVLPWRMRMRWLLASQAMDSGFGLPWWNGLSMREVHVDDVERAGDSVELTLVDVYESKGSTRFRVPTTPATLAKLEGWQATREHLLFITDEHGHRQLDGPDATISGLVRAGSARSHV